MKHLKYCSYILLLNFWQQTDATTYGSTSGVTDYTSQIVLQNGDFVAAFALLEGGFKLLSPGTTATFNSTFPVSGTVDLNGGTLYQLSDVNFSNPLVFQSNGNIIGNQYALNFPNGITQFNNYVGTCVLAEVSQSTTGNAVTNPTWSFDSQYLLTTATGATNVPRASVFQLINNNFVSAGGTITTTNGTQAPVGGWRPGQYQVGLVDGTTFATYNYNTALDVLSTISIVTLPSTSAYSGGVWHPSGSYFATSCGGTNPILIIYPVSSTGLISAPVTTTITTTGAYLHPGPYMMDFDPTGSYLAFLGSNNSLDIYQFNTAALSITLTTSISVANTLLSVKWNPNPLYETLLLVDSSSTTTLLKNIYLFTPSNQSITQIASAPTSSGSGFGYWTPSGLCFGISQDTNAAVIYYYSPTTNTVTTGQILLSPSQNTLAWSPNTQYLATINSTTLTLYTTTTASQSGCYTWSNVFAELSNDLSFNGMCITFSGYSVINGNGNVISLSPTSNLQVNTGSTLCVKNALLKYVQMNRLQTIDNTGTITLQNVTLDLDGNFSFTTGTLDIVNQVNITGNGHQLTFASSNTLIIERFSQLFVDSTMTFSYDTPNQTPNNISMVDATSSIMLNGGTLTTAPAGLILQLGSFLVDGSSLLSSTGTYTSSFIQFGNGTTSKNNVFLRILPAAVLSILGTVNISEV